MENGYDLNLFSADFIKHGKGKTPNDRASKVSVDDGIELWVTNDAQQCVVETLHKFNVQVLALVGIPLARLGELGIRVGSEANEHLQLARLHEFCFDLIPGSTLPGITLRDFQPPIKLSLLSVR